MKNEEKMNEEQVHQSPRIDELDQAPVIWHSYVGKGDIGKRFEVYANSLTINKFRFQIQILQGVESESGAHQVGLLQIYIDAEEALALFHRLGFENPQAQNIKGRTTYWESRPMGTPAAKLKNPRNGHAEYRHMSIGTAMNQAYKYCINIFSCDGKEDEKGLIMPLKGKDGRFSNSLSAMIPLKESDAKAIYYALLRHAIGYTSAQWMTAALSQPVIGGQPEVGSEEAYEEASTVGNVEEQGYVEDGMIDPDDLPF